MSLAGRSTELDTVKDNHPPLGCPSQQEQDFQKGLE